MPRTSTPTSGPGSNRTQGSACTTRPRRARGSTRSSTGSALERDAIRRGVFPGLKSLVDSINRHIDAHNRSTCPYTWTASAETILAKVKHAKETLNHSTIYETDH